MNGFVAILLLIGLICLMVYGYRGLTDNAYASRYNPVLSNGLMWIAVAATVVAIMLAFLQTMG